MAISQIQHVILLLASLFFLPALHAVDFEYCNKSGYDFGNVSRVEISPNPLIKFDDEANISIFGYANQDIDLGSMEVHVKAGDVTHLVRRYLLCMSDFDCSIHADANFVLSLPNVPQDYIEGESKYVYSVRLIDDDVPDSEEPILKLCVEFELPTSDLTLVSA